MLSEALTYIFAKSQNKFKSLGYLREAIAIEARHKRCHSAWSEHLKQSQQRITEAVEKTEGRNRIVLLGAGAGHDIPLDYLLSEFEEIHLVDVIFLKSIREKAKQSPAIKLIESDVTGIINPLFEDKNRINVTDLNLCPPDELLIGADLVVSCNLLSQLPINIKNRLVALGENEDSKELGGFCRSIINSHLKWLESCDASILLISDFERHLVPQDGAKGKIVKSNALFGISFLMPDHLWVWDIAPRPEIDRMFSLKHLVGSIYLQEKEAFKFKS
ncbi:hypothetical protein A9Q97_04015 [Rhodospirillales bacterium 47_12_T64]|nr:hypothetical protein A9Q97_04015 [Rhodospirillales bacterium 47_12_T64]